MSTLFQTTRGAARGLHVDKLLTYLLKDRGSPNTFAHSVLWSGVPVEKLSDLIARIDNDTSITMHEADIGDDGLLDRVSFNVRSPLSYNLQAFGLEALIPNVTKDTADEIFDFAARQGQYVYDRLRLRLEYAAINQTLRNAALMTFNTTVPAAQQWSNRTSPDANPLDDLLTWTRFVREESNRPIHKIYLTSPVWQELQQHPTTIGRMDVTTFRAVTPKLVEEFLHVEPGTIYIDEYGIYKAPGLSGLGSKRYFGGPDVLILTGGGPSRSDNSFGHMYFMGGSDSEPIVSLRYPEFRTPRFAEVVQVSAFVHFLVEEPTAAFVAFNAVNPALARFRGMLSS